MEISFKKNATMLTLLMLVKKGLSIIYKIPYQNLTGDAGFYVFQQVYPFNAILMILTGFAMPIVIGSLLAENNYSAMIKDKLKRSMWICSLSIFTILFLGNEQVALLMGDVLLAPVIRNASIHFLFLPPIAYMRGVLQSRPSTMKKMGYSIVVEQLSRVAAIFAVLYLFESYHHSYYRIAGLAFMFALVSPIITIMHLYLMKPIDDAQSFLPLKEKPQFFRRTAYLMLGSGVLIIFGLIDSFLVFNMLIIDELQPDAMVLKGVLERGLPVLQAGTFFVTSLVALTMSQFEKAENNKQKKIALRAGFFYILGIAIPATFGLIMVMPYLNSALFKDQSGNVTLQVVMGQVVLYSVVVLLTAALSREEKQSFVQASLLIGILAKLIITAPLVRELGIDGAALSSVISLSIMFLIMLIGSKYLFTAKLFVIFLGISISALTMCFGLYHAREFLAFLNTGERSGYLYLLLANTAIGIVIYGLTMAILVWIFKTIGNIILVRHKKRQKRAEQVARARARRRNEILSIKKEEQQEVQRLQEEAKERERYRQSLMHDKPKKSNVTINTDSKVRTYQHMPSGATLGNKDDQPDKQQVSKEPINDSGKEGKQMRLDKFLKVSRIIKRRQTAKEVSDAGKISVNGKVAKSSTSLYVGDEIALHYATRTLVVRVTQIKDSTKKEDADRMYEVIREEPV